MAPADRITFRLALALYFINFIIYFYSFLLLLFLPSFINSIPYVRFFHGSILLKILVTIVSF